MLGVRRIVWLAQVGLNASPAKVILSLTQPRDSASLVILRISRKSSKMVNAIHAKVVVTNVSRKKRIDASGVNPTICQIFSSAVRNPPYKKSL